MFKKAKMANTCRLR